jgi:alpha-tubulin suppressor-like RCC1 family protein
MWGTDSKGSLLTTPEMQSSGVINVPTEVPWTGSSIAKMVCGPKDTAFVLSDGRCLVSGTNKEGQLGQGHKEAVPEPTPVILPEGSGDGIKDVSLGSYIGAYVDTNGDLYTAGFGGSNFSGVGALGHGDSQSYLEPKLVESLIEDDVFVEQVAVGEAHMTVLTTEGEVLTTGAGSYGRLGNFDTIDQLYFEPVELLTNNITEIAGGNSFTLALTQEGVIYGWGRNHKGQLGTGYGLAVDMYAMSAIPEPIEHDELLGRKVIKIAAGRSHAACITEGGELFYWGAAVHLEPVRVNELSQTQIVDVVCGNDYTLAIDVNGKMYSFGTGKIKSGCLGQGSTVQSHQASLMEAFGDLKITQASAGWQHAACLASS